MEIEKFCKDLKVLCTSLSFWIAVMVALFCVTGYLVGLLIWWEWDA